MLLGNSLAPLAPGFAARARIVAGRGLGCERFAGRFDKERQLNLLLNV